MACVAACAFAQSPADTRAAAVNQNSKSRHLPGNRSDSSEIFKPAKAAPQADGIPRKKLKFGVLKSADSDWTEASAQPGYYTIDGYDGQLTCLNKNQAIADIVAAAKVGETMYCISYSDDKQRIYYSRLSTSTWNTIGSREEVDNVNVAADFTHDPKTNGVYGFFYSEDEYSPEFRNFARMNLSTAEPQSIALMEREIYACAAADNGDIYWLSSTQLGKINPAAPADFSYLGSPRLYPEGLGNTMVYNPADGLLYALTTESDMKNGQRIYTSSFSSINPLTKEVALIRRFPSRMDFAGMFVLPEEFSIDAPAEVADASFSFAGSADTMTATVSVTAPSLTFSGAPLSGPLAIIVAAGGKEYYIRDVQPGATAVSEAIPVEQGEISFTISAATAAERGPEKVFSAFAGFDIPEAPANVVLEERQGTPYLSWTAPQMGASGGSVDTDNMTYTVVRLTDGKTVASRLTATEFSDSEYTPNGRALSYSVVAVTPQGESAPAVSNRLAVGVRFEAPYIESFDSADDFDLWSVANVNGGSTWEYSASAKSVQYKYDDAQLPADDWLISPAIHLTPGVIYTARYSYRTMMSSYPESFSVALASSPAPADFSRILSTHSQISNTRLEDAAVTFSVDAEGDYYLGFHAESKPYMYILELDNLGIGVVDKNVPAAPAAITVAAGERGKLEARIDLTAPDADADGKQLDSLSEIRLCRSDRQTPIHVFNAPAPGSDLSFTDAQIDKAGTYTYFAYAVNEAGEGLDARAAAFIGEDVPDAVNSLTIREQNGKPVIEWTAPDKGRNGGWFDADALTYSVYRYFGQLDCIAENITATSASDNSLTIPAASQLAASYVVIPYAGNGAGKAIETDYILLGEPYKAPLVENFPAADMELYPWMSHTDIPIKSAWTLDAVGNNPKATDFSGDGGMATFHSAGETQTGVGSWFVSPKISIADLDAPAVSFAIYHSSIPGIDSQESIQLFAAADGSADYTPVSPVYMRDNGSTGWTKYTVDISSLAGAGYIRFAFKGITAGGADVYIDAFSVDNGRTRDAAVTAIDGPKKIATGETASFRTSVENRGYEKLSAVTLDILLDGSAVRSIPIGDIEAGKAADVAFDISFDTKARHSLTAAAVAPGDEYADNNSLVISVEAVDPVFPTATDLNARVADSEIILSWTPADQKGAVTDDFESYSAWAIDNIGDWTMVDRDFDMTAFINAGAIIPGAPKSYPFCQDPKAWQVCDAAELGINIWPQGTPHSGNKMLMASASLNFVNSDWAISPLLNGAPQTVSFFAKSFTTDGSPEERFRFLYSTGSTEPADFIAVGAADYTSVPEAWTQYRFSIPQGARRFAIECVSDAAFALFIDDVSYNDPTVPAATITGYEVIRDGNVVATVQTPEYRDKNLPEAKAVYSVRTIYDKGTSAQSESITVDLSGITETDIFSGEYRYYNLHGIPVERPQHGIYIRCSAGKTERVVIP